MHAATMAQITPLKVALAGKEGMLRMDVIKPLTSLRLPRPRLQPQQHWCTAKVCHRPQKPEFLFKTGMWGMDAAKSLTCVQLPWPRLQPQQHWCTTKFCHRPQKLELLFKLGNVGNGRSKITHLRAVAMASASPSAALVHCQSLSPPSKA